MQLRNSVSETMVAYLLIHSKDSPIKAIGKKIRTRLVLEAWTTPERVKRICSWCDKEKRIRYFAYSKTHLYIPVCSIKCAEQWNRWCRNKRFEPVHFRNMHGKFVYVRKLRLDQIDLRE